MPWELYFITKGKVGLYEGNKKLCEFTKGMQFGEIPSIYKINQPYDFITENDCTLYSIYEYKFKEIMEEYKKYDMFIDKSKKR